MRRTIIAVSLAAMLVLAGCAGSTTSGPSTASTTSGTDTAESSTVNFYVSDERNAISQFKHLNVTITAVGFKKADAGENETEVESEDEAEVEGETENETDDGNETTESENESAARNEIADKKKSDEWVVKEVNDTTVDLTQLQGENATKLTEFDVENGTYERAFVYISAVNGTLTTGEQVNVKLPSQKLHVNKRFTVGNNETVDFVFDITVHKAGKSGKYILQPVVAESGTEVPIEDVDDDDDERESEEDERESEEDEREAESDLNATFVGNVTAGENATVKVTQNGSTVANATVTVNGEIVGQTDESGTLTFEVAENAEEVEVEIETSEDGEAELKETLATAEEETEEGDESDGTQSVDLAAAFTTNVTAGENATVQVTGGNGTAVENATVEVNGEVVGQTNADGTLTFTVPENAEDVEVEVTKGDAEVTLEAGVVAAANA